jgi:hypothetical protein
MTLVDTDRGPVDPATGEIVDLLDEASAKALTERIRTTVEGLWSLVVEAHDRRAHVALGYATWGDYVRAEFNMSRSRSYQLIDQGRAIAAIEEAVSTVVDTKPRVHVTEREARAIKPNLKDVSKQIAKGLAEAATVEADDVQAVIDDALADAREKQAQQAEDAAALRDLNEKAKAAGMDTDEKSQTERGGFSRLCMDLSKLAPPIEFLARHRAHLTERHIAQAERAYAWLDGFLLELREGK